MHFRVFLLICFLISFYLPSKASWDNQIYVSPSGNDSQGCGNRDRPCKSLNEAFAIALNGTGGTNSTLISAAKGNYTLTKSFNFTNVNTFALVGEGSRLDEVRITCEPDVSLSFILCQNIAFEGFMLQRCGGWRERTVGINKSAHAGQSHQGVKFRTALDFRYCRNARFTNIEISSSPGLGVNLYDVGGVVNFTDCVLADNKALTVNKSSNGSLQGFIEEGYVHSGGGIYMILNQYGDNVVNITPSEHDSFQHNNTYIFRNCHFLRNEASGWNVSQKHDIIDDPGPSQFSLGGGLAINFRGNASNCSTIIESCIFLGNYAVWGGGLQVETRNEVKNNHFAIENTSFHDNTGLLAGGGVRMGNLLQRGASDPLNTFTFDICSFMNNSAIWGGGMSLYGTSVLCRINCANHKTQFIFNRSTWCENKGTVGAALATMLADQNNVQIGPEIPYSITFTHCSFSSNLVVKLYEGVTIGEGTLFSDQVRLIFQGTTSFRNNTNTALSLDGSAVEIFDKVNFINNNGYRGGAVAMRGLSRMIFQTNSHLFFYNNSCEHKGGALYIESVGSPLVDFNATGVNTHECFFGYTEENVDFNRWKTSVIFQGNRAVDDGKGNSVYATTLRNCRKPGEFRKHNNVLKWKFIQFKTLHGNVTSRDSEVATDAIDMRYEPNDWKVAPGEVFNATVKLIDEIGNSVIGIVEVDINVPENTSPVKLDTTSSLFLTDGYISFLRLAGKPGSLFTVSLRYVGRQTLVELIPDIKMQSCHEGFYLDGSTCACSDSIDEGVTRCDSDGKTVYLKQGYWAGKVGKKFVTHRCPTAYCNFTESVFPGEYQYFSGHVCKGERNQTSVLCGECNSGCSVLFGNENCSPSCTNRWLWMIIAYVIALFAGTCFVLLVNPNLSSGHLNACLYSYQIMKILTPHEFTFDPFIEFLVAFCNLRIHTAHGICFASGLNNADKLIIMAAVPVVEIFILKLLTILYPVWRRALERLYNELQHSQCCTGTCSCRNAFLTWLNNCWESFNERGENGFAYAFCTIAVLCYVDITHISLQLLHPVKVGGRTVLFADGNMEFFKNGHHILYGSIAIALMLGVICVPVIFIFYTGSNRHLEPLRACYKTGRHPFVAFYLGCRVILLVISTYVPDGPLKSALLQFFCFLFLFTIAISRPYREENEGGGDPQVVYQGENGPALVEQGARGNEVENHGEAADEIVQNRWINESDLVILTTLGAIVVLSSPISSGVSKSIGNGLIVCVKILAYAPLVMAVLPYVLKAFNALRSRRNAQVPEPGDGPSQGDSNLTERAPLLGSAPLTCDTQQHRVPNEPADIQLNPPIQMLQGDNSESRFVTAEEEHDEWKTAPESPTSEIV